MNGNGSTLPPLPKGWVWTTIESVFDIVLGQSPPSSTYNTDESGLPFFQGKAEFGDIYPTVRKWCTAPTKIAEKGDVLISVRAPVGPTNIAREKSGIGRGLAALRPLENVPSLFALYLLRSFEHDIAGKGTGTTFQAITGDKLRRFEIPFPPLPEQRRIVAKIEELFTKLDAGVEALKTVKAELKRYRQSVLKAAFEGKLTEEWRTSQKSKLKIKKQETAAELLERIREAGRKRYIEKRKEQLREYVRLRIRLSAVDDRPEEALQDFILEMVIDDRDKSHPKLIDSIVAMFLQTIPGKYDLDDELMNYIQWLNDSFEAMKNEGVRSEILETQLEVWKAYVQEQLTRSAIGDHVEPVFAPQRPGMRPLLKMLATNWVLEQGCSYAREKILEQPAWKEWEEAEAKRKRNEIDTSQLPELPEGWAWATVTDLASLEPNSITDGPFGSNLKTSHYTTSGPRVVRLQNIGDGTFIDEHAHISTGHFQKLLKHQVFPGDVVVASLGTDPPRACIIPESLGKAIVKADCIRFNVHPTMNNKWIAFVLNSEPIKTWAAKIVHGVGRPRLNLANIRRIPIPIPSRAEQLELVSEIERRFSVADAIEKTVDEGLMQAERLRQSILKRAFEGKLVPQDPSDPPAYELLGKIKRDRREQEETVKGKLRRENAPSAKGSR